MDHQPFAKSRSCVASSICHLPFRLAAQAIYDFIWNEYCDWYVELTKPVNDANVSEERKAEVRRVLLVMEASLRLAPNHAIPDWRNLADLCTNVGQKVAKPLWLRHTLCLIKRKSMIKLKRICNGYKVWLVRYVTSGGEMGLGNARLLPVLLQNTTEAEREQITRIEALFKALAK